MALAPQPLVPLIILFLPESIRYLVEKSKLNEAQSVIMEVVGSYVTINLTEESSEMDKLKYSLKNLFSKKYAKNFFAVCFMGIAYLHLSWYISMASNNLRQTI